VGGEHGEAAPRGVSAVHGGAGSESERWKWGSERGGKDGGGAELGSDCLDALASRNSRVCLLIDVFGVVGR
jgi:hypothetical protein